jgi:hypothetical protein
MEGGVWLSDGSEVEVECNFLGDLPAGFVEWFGSLCFITGGTQIWNENKMVDFENVFLLL